MRRTNPPGLVIAGTTAGCGKTVLTAGIAATLQAEGLKARAVKPICLGSAKDAQAEYAFLTTIAHSPVDYQVQFAETPGALRQSQFQAAIKTATSGTDPILVELPGGTATPLTITEGAGRGWQDAGEFAAELLWPAILISKLGPDCFELLSIHASYLREQGVDLLGVATVMTDPDCKLPVPPNQMLAWEMSLAEKIRSPYLGCLRYSQSISVPKVNQGNLITTTSDTLDLLPIIKAITLRLAV